MVGSGSEERNSGSLSLEQPLPIFLNSPKYVIQMNASEFLILSWSASCLANESPAHGKQNCTVFCVIKSITSLRNVDHGNRLFFFYTLQGIKTMQTRLLR